MMSYTLTWHDDPKPPIPSEATGLAIVLFLILVIALAWRS